MNSPLSNILARGYFPKELPPPFHTKSFGAFADTSAASVMALDLSKKGVKKNVCSVPATHNLARSGTLRRKLTIPNPVNQYQVTWVVAHNWAKLKAACKSQISLTTPRYLKHGQRAINTTHSFDAIPVARARSRTASQYMLTADLSQFYQSVYTHSIPWALHTKAVAKANPSDFSLLGNVLDLAIRNGQDRQTMGIPIGPDTSLVIAEVLLASVDSRLDGPMVRRGFRYIDDFGCGFQTIAEAESLLGNLQRAVGDLQLQLNPKKTGILGLPSVLEASWVPHLRLFAFRSKSANAQQTDLLSYFGRAFELALSHKEEAILRYSVQRMRSESIFAKNWEIYESLLLQCLSVEPGTAPAIVRELYKYSKTMPLDRVRITESLQQLIVSHAPLHHGSEVVWALWGAICLGCKLDAEVVDTALLTSDPCVTLCALHAQSVGLVNGQIDSTGVDALMKEAELFGDHWLVAYEANVKGWLPNPGGKDFVGANRYFGPMKAAGVSFYNANATLDVVAKSAAPINYEAFAGQLDFSASNSTSDVSGEWF